MTIFGLLAIVCGGLAVGLSIGFTIRSWVREARYYRAQAEAEDALRELVGCDDER